MKEKVAKALKRAISEEIAIEVSVPDQEEFGHYSTNVAFKLARVRRTSPITVAEEIVSKIKTNKLFSHVAVANPGFVNVWISEKELAKELGIITKEKNKYGTKKQTKTTKKKMQVEFVSANPTGPLTLANGRGGFLGDAIANVLFSQGHSVEREYYVNDTGNQVQTLGKSIVANCGFIQFEENYYKGEYVKTWAETHTSFVEKNKNKFEIVGEQAAKDFLKIIKEALEKKARIHFDRYTSEKKDIHENGYVKKVLDMFSKLGKTYKADGAVWLKTTEYGDDKDRVLITSEKAPTYFLADAGHYLETKKRGFTGKVLILGPDHYGYVARIQAAAEIIGLKESKVIITQAVRLVDKGSEVKMSKRKGQFVTFGELMEEVGMDAARFFFLMISPDSHMDFDIGLAKEHSVKNPVFYVQYALVRAGSILGKTKKQMTFDFSLLSTKEDLTLARKLIEFPDILESVSEDFGIHHLTQYAIECSKAFHNFYEKEKVDEVDKKIAGARRALVEASYYVLGNTLRILGCSTPQKM
jgi:arginyl-tRNA synthetase